MSRIAGDDRGRSLIVATPLGAEMEPGDSIAVNGVCLTATDVEADHFSADVVLETIRRTNLGHLLAGDRVNLERPIRADGRFDGHLVQGHVDSHGAVISHAPEGNGVRLGVEVGSRHRRYLVEKGSIAVDGVSLTIASVKDNVFEVALIPFTLQHTNLSSRKPGSQVNLEFDVLAKYVESLLEARQSA